jgi:hypothetical protein
VTGAEKISKLRGDRATKKWKGRQMPQFLAEYGPSGCHYFLCPCSPLLTLATILVCRMCVLHTRSSEMCVVELLKISLR